MKLKFRAFEEIDYKLINKWRNNYDLQKNIVGLFRFVSPETEKKWVKSKIYSDLNSELYLAVIDTDSKEMIGYTSFNDINPIFRSAHGGGIVIGEQDYQGKGISTKIMKMKLDYGFRHLNLHRITGSCLIINKESFLMMRLMGYKLEVIERTAVFKRGRFYDLLKFSLLENEYYYNIKENKYNEESYIKVIRSLKKEYNTILNEGIDA